MTHEINRGSKKGGHPIADATARAAEERVRESEQKAAKQVAGDKKPEAPKPKRSGAKKRAKVSK